MTEPRRRSAEPVETLAEAVALSACTLAESVRAACLITFTSSGSTARLVSRYRPGCSLLAPTPRLSTYRRLALVWGVVPILSRRLKTADGMIRQARWAALDARLAAKGQKVVITAGVPLGVPGTTNLIKAEEL